MNSAEREKITDIRNLAYRLAMLEDTNEKEALIKAIETEEREIIHTIFDSIKMLKVLSQRTEYSLEGTDLWFMNHDIKARKIWVFNIKNLLKLIVKLSQDTLDEVEAFDNAADEYIQAKKDAES